MEEDAQDSLSQKTALIARLQKELLEERDRLAEAKADMAQFADELAAGMGYSQTIAVVGAGRGSARRIFQLTY